MSRLGLSINLIVTSNIKENYNTIEFNIYNSYISGNRKSSLSRQLTMQSMIVKKVQSAFYEQLKTVLELINKLPVRTNMLFEMFLKCPIAFDLLHGYKSFMKSLAVGNGPDRSVPFIASLAARFSRSAAASLGSPHSSISKSIRRSSTTALIMTRRYACAESKPSCLALAVNCLRTFGSSGTWIVDESLIYKGYQSDITMSIPAFSGYWYEGLESRITETSPANK